MSKKDIEEFVEAPGREEKIKEVGGIDFALLGFGSNGHIAGNEPFYAPGSGRPCVYYHVTVHEERRRVTRRQNAEGEWREDVSYYWHEIARDSKFEDFYLQDGTSKVFIQASSGGCKIQGHKSGGGASMFQFPPPGIARMIAERCMMDAFGDAFWHHRRDGRTGKFRYCEESFDVNELVAALGVSTPAQDPYTGQAVKVLNPFNKQTLSEQYMDDNKWDSWDKQSWQDLLKYPAVLLSDRSEFTGGVFVQPAQQLPAYMTQAIPQAQPNGNQSQQYAPAPQNQPQMQQNPVAYAQPVQQSNNQFQRQNQGYAPAPQQYQQQQQYNQQMPPQGYQQQGYQQQGYQQQGFPRQ